MEYGDAGNPDWSRLRRIVWRCGTQSIGPARSPCDEAGLTTVAAVDFKGNILDKSRRVIADAPILAVFKQGAGQWLGGHTLPGRLGSATAENPRRPRSRAVGDRGLPDHGDL